VRLTALHHAIGARKTLSDCCWPRHSPLLPRKGLNCYVVDKSDEAG
jgi:hypothetical protein